VARFDRWAKPTSIPTSSNHQPMLPVAGVTMVMAATAAALV
jgi:hypothetical protein